MNIIELSKLMSYLLRHNPKEINLILDERGSIDIDVLIKHIKLYKNLDVSKKEILELAKPTDKVRFEIEGNLIRALNGHSSVNVIKDEVIPPDILYHGTSFEVFKKSIMVEGIKPMSRQYVHLSLDIKTAQIVGQRHNDDIVILEINAKQMYDDGIKFYHGNIETFLVDYIDPKYFVPVNLLKPL